MGTVGPLLRQVRKGNEISIEKVSKDTKISSRYLRAIEGERWEELPGPTYIKGYLHIYADYLGLNAKEVVAQHLRETISSITPSITPSTPKKPKSKMYLIYGCILILSMLCIIWFFSKTFFQEEKIKQEKKQMPKEAITKVPLTPGPKLQQSRPLGLSEQPATLKVTSIKIFPATLRMTKIFMCKDVKNREPIEPGEDFSIEDSILIHCFTEIQGAKSPQKVRHVWYYKDKQVMTTVLSVNGPRWRTWSKKSISKDLKGEWHIDILDPKKKKLALVSFTVD